MALVRSKTFLVVGLAPQTITVPAGKRWLVKYAMWHKPTTGATTAVLQLQAGSGTIRQIVRVALGADATFYLQQAFTLDAGDHAIFTSGSGDTVIHVSGIEFTP